MARPRKSEATSWTELVQSKIDRKAKKILSGEAERLGISISAYIRQVLYKEIRTIIQARATTP